MKKVLTGILVAVVVLAAVGSLQYTSRPDTYGLDSNLSQTVNV